MPFETIVSNTGENTVITLKDLSNGTFAEVYAYGALLNKFSALNKEEEPVNVIEGFSDTSEANQKLTNFFKSAKLSPYVCRVKEAEYTFGEKNYKLSKHFSQKDAIHGLLYNAVFSIKTHTGNNTAASVKLEYIYDNTKEGYPFCYKCEVEYELTAGNSLAIRSTITNLDEKLMPLADGWHPYFTLGDDINNYQLEFQSKEMLEFDNLIPTGKFVPFQEFGSLKNLGTTVFDNCFTLNFAECQPLCVIRNPLRKVQVEIHPLSSYPYLQIFTPNHRKSIAVENLSAAPDAFNNGIGLKVLEPNTTAEFSTRFMINFL